jgi:predicted Zn-dependent protease
VRGATLIGNGPEVLQSIDMVGSDLGFSNGPAARMPRGSGFRCHANAPHPRDRGGGEYHPDSVSVVNKPQYEHSAAITIG